MDFYRIVDLIDLLGPFNDVAHGSGYILVNLDRTSVNGERGFHGPGLGQLTTLAPAESIFVIRYGVSQEQTFGTVLDAECVRVEFLGLHMGEIQKSFCACYDSIHVTAEDRCLEIAECFG